MPSINDRRINHHSNSSKNHRSRRKHGGDSNSSDSSSPYSSDDQSNEDKNSQRHKTGRLKSPIATIAHSLILSELPSNINYEDLIKSLLEIRCTYKKVFITEQYNRTATIEFHTLKESERFFNVTKGRIYICGFPLNIRHITNTDNRSIGAHSKDSRLCYDRSDTQKCWIDESEPCNVIILKGLDVYTTEEEVRNVVCHLTNTIVYDVRLIKDKVSNVSRGFCFVELGNVDDARTLMQFLKNMTPAFSINGRKVTLGYARNNFGFSCNARAANNTVASNAIAAARAASTTLPPHLTDPITTTQNSSSYISVFPGDHRNYTYDSQTGYYFDPSSGLYYDGNTGSYYNPYTQDFLYIDPATNTLTPFARNTAEKKEIHKTPKKAIDSQGNTQKTVSVEATKIAQDMEKWAKRINDQTASKVIAKKQHIHQIHEKQKKTVELKDKIEAQELFNTLSSGPNKSLDNKDKILLEETIESDPHLSVHDLACLLCQRKFSSKDVLIKHVTSSNLHLTNLKKISKI